MSDSENLELWGKGVRPPVSFPSFSLDRKFQLFNHPMTGIHFIMSDALTEGKILSSLLVALRGMIWVFTYP